MEGRLNVSVEPRATFTSARGFSYIAYTLFTLVKITRQWKSTLSHQDRTALDQKNPFVLSNSRIVILVNSFKRLMGTENRLVLDV